MTASAVDHRASIIPAVYRHSLLVRVTHWINVLCLTLLLMSGLQIFNAHSALYWGQASDFSKPILAITARDKDGGQFGATEVLGHTFDTTGVLGLSGPPDNRQQRGFPAWITLPGYQDLATGRRWHFFFAWMLVINGIVYLASGFLRGHFWRDLLPSREQFRHIGRSIVEHLRLRFPRGEEAKHYNVLQKLSYLIVVFIVLPLLIIAGLTMSPGIDAAFPWLTSVFGGRQSARTVHFLAAFTLVAFVAVHVLMVLISGLWNNMRSMITGWYTIKPAGDTHGG
jgi:thiosulfate reductase cytochrome b subunit